jgi:patatin-like phospholipase/acyl hydrolase
LFDAIAGTSTGGMLALGLTKPGGDLAHRARDLAQLYIDRGATIFTEGTLRRALYAVLDRTPGIPQLEERVGLPRHVELKDLLHPKYPATGRHDVLQKFFETAKLRDATARVLITSYDTEARMPIFFVSRDQDVSHTGSYQAVCDQISMLDAALATSAAPTYFPPHQIVDGVGSARKSYSLVDGGVFANNPTGIAHAFLKQDTDVAGDIVLSLGTGSMTDCYPFSRIENWGAIQWASPVLKMMFDGQSAAVALVMEQRLREAHYYRFQADLSGEFAPLSVSDDLDDTSAENIAAMKTFAAKLIEKHRSQLDALCRSLVDAPARTARAS